MIRRAQSGKAPQLVFTKDYREYMYGDLKPGATVHIDYDAERLPQERSYVDGQPAWSITVCAQFHKNDVVHRFPLRSETGIVVTKSWNTPGGGTMLTSDIAIPYDATALILWFVNTGASGATYYDSAFGRNFVFPFLDNDIWLESADVTAGSTDPMALFSVVAHVTAGASNLGVDYRVINRQPVSETVHHRPLVDTARIDADGRHIWSSNGIPVPQGAVVAFSLVYVKDGFAFFDDNHHRGYLAPQPPAAVAARDNA